MTQDYQLIINILTQLPLLIALAWYVERLSRHCDSRLNVQAERYEKMLASLNEQLCKRDAQIDRLAEGITALQQSILKLTTTDEITDDLKLIVSRLDDKVDRQVGL